MDKRNTRASGQSMPNHRVCSWWTRTTGNNFCEYSSGLWCDLLFPRQVNPSVANDQSEQCDKRRYGAVKDSAACSCDFCRFVPL